MNKFRKWVADQGVENVAKRFDKTPRAVYVWLQGRGTPTARAMYALVTAAKGAFSYEDIIDCTILKKK